MIVLPHLTTARSSAESSTIVAEAKWADIVALGDNLWGVISKPLEGSFETVCNGGIVAGKERVLAFDSYATEEGARWLVEQTRERLGRAPTDLVLSHHHSDHTGGIAGFDVGSERPRLHLTEAIRQRLLSGASEAVAERLREATVIPTGEPTEIDLGGRSVTLTPYSGHTRSDIVARIDDAVTYYGDLVWHELFPNYVDAIPSELKTSIAALLKEPAGLNVPGHGPLPDRESLVRYQNLLDEIEATARAAFEAGKSPAEAAKDYQLPESVGRWTLFNPGYFEVAFRAWHRELRG